MENLIISQLIQYSL